MTIAPKIEGISADSSAIPGGMRRVWIVVIRVIRCFFISERVVDLERVKRDLCDYRTLMASIHSPQDFVCPVNER
ncbi:hypothetical protein [Pseudomonas laurentiana]|uniref:hypothetical protein n=1 Tax=Pseudomonas laurentiana TaxID=2364649 RepID=UPI001671CD67|nr:hypothetical protein [Pseudomonas laurentiana]